MRLPLSWLRDFVDYAGTPDVLADRLGTSGFEIEGILQKPQSALVLERKKANFNPLIKLRTDWNDAIDESVDEVK